MQTIKNELLVVQATEVGAELRSIKTSDGVELVWQGNPQYWHGVAPNLFPYVARLVEGRYKLDGKEYEMGIHGFARKMQFSVAKATKNTLEFELTQNEETLAQYPRRFSFKVIYTLQDSTLSITYLVKNLDEKDMYFGLGGHPGFNVPMGKCGRFEDYKLRFGEPCKPFRVEFDERCFVTGRRSAFVLEEGTTIPLRHDMFDCDAIVLADTSKSVILEGEFGKTVTVSFPDMPYIGFWHAVKTDAPYVCIEPWVSLPATAGKIVELEKQEDLIHLASGGEYSNTWTIAVGEKLCNDEIKFVRPSIDYAKEIEDYKATFVKNCSSMDGCGALKYTDSVAEFLKKVAYDYNEETLSQGRVTADLFLAVRKSDNKLVGMCQVRRTLNEFLAQFGGHIGYSVRPDERGKGYAKAMLKLALLHCKSLGINKVLVTCLSGNVASEKTILSAGGVHECDVPYEGGKEIIKRFWINND